MKKIELIIEKGDGEFWGRIEDKGDFLPVTVGETVPKVIENIKELIEDYQQHEGKEDKFWSKVNIRNVEFDIKYDIQALFAKFNELNVSAIAKRAGMNESLVRQYASGKKFPSGEQVKKIENALHQIGLELQQVKIYA